MNKLYYQIFDEFLHVSYTEAEQIFNLKLLRQRPKILFIPYLPLFKTGVPQISVRKDVVYANITLISLKTFILK